MQQQKTTTKVTNSFWACTVKKKRRKKKRGGGGKLRKRHRLVCDKNNLLWTLSHDIQKVSQYVLELDSQRMYL